MGILSYIKIGTAVAILLVIGYFVYDYKHMKTVIAQQQDKIAGLELRADIIEEAQAATDAFMKKKGTVQVRVVKEKANVDKVVESGDDPAMQQLFINNGLLQPSKAGASPGRPAGNP